MATRWQQLGALVATARNVDDERLKKFAQVGGRWIAPVVYGDDSSGPWNLANLSPLKARASSLGIATGGWFNCWGGDPVVDARNIARIVRDHQLKLVILDLEAPYKYPDGQPHLMPLLLWELRKLLPVGTIPIGVTSYGKVDRAMIWNGRTLDPPQSFYDLRIRFLPQWYSFIYGTDASYRPDMAMLDLKENGASDFNIMDPTAPGGRGIPLSYVHGLLEATGLEGSSLEDEIFWLRRACRLFGYTFGWILYLLENVSEPDWPLIEAERGKTFLV